MLDVEGKDCEVCVDDERGASFDVARKVVFAIVACDSATSN